MPRESWLCNVELGRKLTDAPFSVPEQVDDLETDLIRERVKESRGAGVVGACGDSHAPIVSSFLDLSMASSRHALPHPLQVHGAQRPVEQPVARTTALAPNHPPMIGSHRTTEARVGEHPQHGQHVDVAER